MTEGDLAFLMQTDKFLVSAYGSGTGGQAKDKGFVFRGFESVDTLYNVLGGPRGHASVVGVDNYAHNQIFCYLKGLMIGVNR
jgi:hypothetical protein